jgi:DNA-binding transcriptional MerR regulator
MFRIGDFSRLTRVSIKTLRHYDRMGLLVPASVDRETGYRSYAARQVVTLRRILALRDQGFALEHIRDLMRGSGQSGVLARVLEAKKLELERQLELDQARLDRLVARLAEIESGTPIALPEVVVSEAPAVRAATRRARVARIDDGIEELFESLERDVAAAGARGAGPPLVLYHDCDHRETDALVEVAVPVLSAEGRIGRSAVRTIPALRSAACVVYGGSYDQWADLSRGLVGWLAARRLVPAGAMREVFLQFGVRDPRELAVPHSYLADRTADYLTEIQIPVRRRS